MKNYYSLLVVLAAVLAIGPATGAAKADLVALYEFEDDASDSTSNGLNGTLMGDASIVSDDERGNVLSLDGDGDYVDCGNNSVFDATEAITVAAWIKVDAFDKSWQSIVTKGDNTWRLARHGNYRHLKFKCDGLTIDGVKGRVRMDDGKWHHAAAVYDGEKLSMYIDGELNKIKYATGSINTDESNVYIGANSTKEGREWNGLIDDVAIFDHALDPNEVTQLYTQGGASFN